MKEIAKSLENSFSQNLLKLNVQIQEMIFFGQTLLGKNILSQQKTIGENFMYGNSYQYRSPFNLRQPIEIPSGNFENIC